MLHKNYQQLIFVLLISHNLEGGEMSSSHTKRIKMGPSLSGIESSQPTVSTNWVSQKESFVKPKKNK